MYLVERSVIYLLKTIGVKHVHKTCDELTIDIYVNAMQHAIPRHNASMVKLQGGDSSYSCRHYYYAIDICIPALRFEYNMQ